MLSRARNFQTWCDTYNTWLQTELTGTFTKRDLHHFPSYSNRPHRRWNAWIIIKVKYVTNKNKTPISKKHNHTQSNKLCKNLFSTIMSADEDSLLFLNSIFFNVKIVMKTGVDSLFLKCGQDTKLEVQLPRYWG